MMPNLFVKVHQVSFLWLDADNMAARSRWGFAWQYDRAGCPLPAGYQWSARASASPSCSQS